MPYPFVRGASDDGWRPVWESDDNVASIGRNKHNTAVQNLFSLQSPVKAVYLFRRTT